MGVGEGAAGARNVEIRSDMVEKCAGVQRGEMKSGE